MFTRAALETDPAVVAPFAKPLTAAISVEPPPAAASDGTEILARSSMVCVLPTVPIEQVSAPVPLSQDVKAGEGSAPGETEVCTVTP